MNNSYRLQAERRASLSRTPVTVSRVTVKPPLALPPWGYGNARYVAPVTPATTRRVSGAKTHTGPRCVSSAKQTNSCCKTGVVRPGTGTGATNTASPSASNKIQHSAPSAAGEEPEFHVVETKAGRCADKLQTCEQAYSTCTAAVTPGHTVQSPNVVINDAAEVPTTVAGGGPVASSSMETWTTYDDNYTSPSSPRVPSTVTSPYSFTTTPELTSTVDTLASPGTAWLPARPVTSPTTTAAADSVTDHNMSTPPVPLDDDCTNGKLSSGARDQATADNVSTTSPKDGAGKSEEKNNETLAVTGTEATTSAGLEREELSYPTQCTATKTDGTSKALLNQNSSDTKLKCPAIHATLKITSDRSLTTTSKKNVKDEKSSLMVGLVKVKSKHTGFMVDCPILEMVYQSDSVQSPTTAVKKSSSHKVVIIKAMVPRRAWNGRGEDLTPMSPSRSSISSANATDLTGLSISRTLAYKSSLVSVDTQTSETLLVSTQSPVQRDIAVRRTSSYQPKWLNLAFSAVDDYTSVPAVADNSLQLPSPKLSTSSVRGSPKATTANKRPLYLTDKDKCVQSSLRASHQSSSAVNNTLVMSENVEEVEIEEGRAGSIERDSLMDDTSASLKLDLHFSSSGSNSDNESDAYRKAVSTLKDLDRASKSSSDNIDQYHESLSPNCQRFPPPAWPYDAALKSTAVDVDSKGHLIVSDPVSGQNPASTFGNSHSLTSADRSVTLGLTLEPGTVDCKQDRSNNLAQRRSQRTELDCWSNVRSRRHRASKGLWRTAVSTGPPGCDVAYRNLCPCLEQQQHLLLKQQQMRPTPTSHYASGSESSLTDRSQSGFYGCYDPVGTPTSPPRMPQRSRYKSTPPPNSQWITAEKLGQLDTDAPASSCDVDMRRSSRTRCRDNFRTTPGCTCEQQTDHYRMTPSSKAHAEYTTCNHCQQLLKQPEFEAKRSVEQRRQLLEAQRRFASGQSQSSRRAASVPAERASSSQETRVRQHSTSTTRRCNTAESQRCCSDPRVASSLRRHPHPCQATQHRQTYLHTEQAAAGQMACGSKRRQSSGRHESRVSKPVHVSASVSAGSVSAHHCTSLAEQSTCSPAERQPRCRQLQSLPMESTTQYQKCEPAVTYFSPRSHKPFPPPISDAVIASRDAGAETSSDTESVKCVLPPRSINDALCPEYWPPSAHLPASRHGRHRHLDTCMAAAETAISMHQPRDKKQDSYKGNNHRRTKLSVTPAVHGQARSPAPGVGRNSRPTKRPVWKPA